MKVKRFVSDLDRIMSLIYDDVPLPPREVTPREVPLWEERARETVGRKDKTREAVGWNGRQQETRYKKGIRERAVKPVKPEIRIDLSALSAIRADAEYTMERLMTEEERDGFSGGSNAAEQTNNISNEPLIPELYQQNSCGTQATDGCLENGPLENSQNEAALTDVPEEVCGLTPLEAKVLCSLMEGKDVKGMDLKGKLLSVIIDAINDKLYEQVGDLVIENDTVPELIEDYRDELMEMFAK